MSLASRTVLFEIIIKPSVVHNLAKPTRPQIRGPMHFSDVFNCDGYLIEDDERSDDDCAGDSSDEDEELFSKFLSKTDIVTDQHDFLTEMNKELDEIAAKIESQSQDLDESATDKSNRDCGQSPIVNSTEQQFYDDIYFDSDDSDHEGKKKHPIPNNEDLFYDPDADEEDQEWVDIYRRSCRSKSNASTAKIQKLPNTDAVLNCPACMTQLCLDCQRHEIYTNQYRAMFVENCSINFVETLKFPLKSKKGNRKEDSTPGEIYHPKLRCMIKTRCTTFLMLLLVMHNLIFKVIYNDNAINTDMSKLTILANIAMLSKAHHCSTLFFRCSGANESSGYLFFLL
uniref:E2F-associated phosphoprotein n=1 Tax=Strigamia maritima TaxID=126957 RepID=T1IK60_STRMM